MRIISQDGIFDLPYEQAVVAYPLSDLESSDYIELASYSTEDKAIKAMEMCREEWTKVCGVGGGLHTQPAILTWPKAFRFPADEEVKV